MSTQSLQVDPRTLRLPVSHLAGADPAKLQRQIAQHGKSTKGMPPVIVMRGTDGELIIYDGVTRDPRGEAAARYNGPRGSHRRRRRSRRELSDRSGETAMISPVRQDALQLLTRLSELAPEVRLGQLLVNLSYMARGMKVESIWDMEDEELVEAATKHIDQWQALLDRRAAESSKAGQAGSQNRVQVEAPELSTSLRTRFWAATKVVETQRPVLDVGPTPVPGPSRRGPSLVNSTGTRFSPPRLSRSAIRKCSSQPRTWDT